MHATAVRGVTAALSGAFLCVACGSGGACVSGTKPSESCPAVTFQSSSYVEWREVHPAGVLQEVGDAYYPACNKAGTCGGDPLDGMGSTDVWRYDGVDPAKAVIGLREDTHTYVVFVRVGVDPAQLGLSGRG